MTEDEMFMSVCSLFNESQFHVSSHRKNIQSLRKIHAKAVTSSNGETRFLQAMCHCLHVILSMKKADDVSNKLMRFFVGFIVRSADGVNAAPTTGVFVERFVEGLMSHVLEHLDSKEKLIRSRLCQIMVACLNSVQELTDEIWNVFRIKMTERLFDKESIVRVHAIYSMGRLQSLPVEEDSDITIADIFLDLMQHDPSADVRKAALLQVEITPQSLPLVLERRRDVDVGIRKLFFSKKMNEVDVLSLSIQQRDEILKSGLTDREAAVRQACSEMVFDDWIQKSSGNLIQFLSGLDVVANSQVAEIALKSFFEKLPDMLKGSFNEDFLKSMTAEMAFILRVYCQHQVQLNKGDRETVQELLPELSVMTEFIREKYDSIITTTDELARSELEFVLNELLVVSGLLDFSDEVGRRALLEAIREIMSNLEISDFVFQSCIKLYTDHADSMSEFLDDMTEFITSFRDVYESSNGLSPAAPSDYSEDLPDDIRIMANLRALEIVKSVFSMGEITFAKFPILVAYLDEIVIPSVNSPFAAVQASGLKCLGLCCTIERGLATEYMGLFCDFYKLGHEEGRLTALQIIFDLIFLYGNDPIEGEAVGAPDIIAVLTTALYDSIEAVQEVAAVGFSKLFLHRILHELQILEGLFFLYLHHAISASSPIKQCLSYFFQAYAFISSRNQISIGGLIGKVLANWLKVNDCGSGASSLSSVTSQLLYLVDRGNLIDSAMDKDSIQSYSGLYAQIAIDLSWLALSDPVSESGKQLCSIVCKLPLKSFQPDSQQLLKQLLFLQTQLMKYVSDKTTLNLLKRFTATLLQLDSQDEPLEFEILNELRSQLGKILPAGIKAAYNANHAGAATIATTTKKAVKTSPMNIMDEISDLLDE